MAITKPGFASAGGTYEVGAGFFSGLKNIVEEWKGHGGLRGLLLRVNTAVEDLIDLVEDGTGTIRCGALYVAATGASYASGYYFIADGTRYPVVAGMHWVDTVGAVLRTVRVTGGAWVIT